MKFSLTLIFVFISFQVFGQQNAMLPKYTLNSLLYNPAYAGFAKHHFFSLSAQWKLSERQSIFQEASYHAPLNDSRFAIGFSFLNDQAGIFNQKIASGAGRYSFIFSKGTFEESKLILGIQGSITSWKTNWEQLFSEFPILAFNPSKEKYLNYNIGLGLMYRNRRGYLGFSIPYINNQELTKEIKNPTIRQFRHYFVLGGINIPLDLKEDWVIKPSFLLKKSDSNLNSYYSLTNFPTELEVDLTFFIFKRWGIGGGVKTAFQQNTFINEYDVRAIWYFMNGFRINLIYHHSLEYHKNNRMELAVIYELQRGCVMVYHPNYY